MFKKEMTTSCVYTSSSGNISLTKKIFSSQKSPCFPDKTNTLFENVITFERVKKIYNLLLEKDIAISGYRKDVGKCNKY